MWCERGAPTARLTGPRRGWKVRAGLLDRGPGQPGEAYKPWLRERGDGFDPGPDRLDQVGIEPKCKTQPPVNSGDRYETRLAQARDRNATWHGPPTTERPDRTSNVKSGHLMRREQGGRRARVRG